MKSVKEIYKEYSDREDYRPSMRQEVEERGRIIDLLYENYIKLEDQYKILSDMIKELRAELLIKENDIFELEMGEGL